MELCPFTKDQACPYLSWKLRTHLRVVTNLQTHGYLRATGLACLSQPQVVTLKEWCAPGFNASLPGLLETWYPSQPSPSTKIILTDSPPYLGLRSTRKCNFGVNLRKNGKVEVNCSTLRKEKKSMVNHVIINHSFLRLITQLLVTSRATQQFF